MHVSATVCLPHKARDTRRKQFIHVYTDGSVDRRDGTATASCYIQAFGVAFEYRINFSMSILIAELCGIRFA